MSIFNSFLQKTLYIAVVLFYALSGNGQSPLNNTWEITSQTLTQKWELDEESRKGTFRIQSYKPIYISLARWSSSPNTDPYSENPDYTSMDTVNLNSFEAKFQISLKSKLWQGIFGDYGDLWAGFTQTAYWQIYNNEISRPFRELNYEPELMLVFPMRMQALGFDLRLLGGGFNHQSNGKDLPQSRSWNRIFFNAAFERDGWQINLKPWIRIPDNDDDQNPEISNYIGRAEINVSYQFKKQTVYAVIKQPFNSLNRGSLQLNYVFPVKANLRFHLQVFTGYGETLIDYNHKQTTVGLGISFFDW
ncbi:phospholipase A [Cryomorpha ignava]|uniref:Phosphatidylcholine 1-acylhydrolase n=1 Tax=Cryomorpha ignava TaxID=101383 RepID=A0A7K3WR74_9FLAO|nr:phospholipase A [Cryomorpha ignava]NEN23215.1 phospholipase A [Cryomorpha ignava]